MATVPLLIAGDFNPRASRSAARVTNSEMQESAAIMCRFGLDVQPFS